MAEKGEYKRAYLLSDAEADLILGLLPGAGGLGSLAHTLYDSLKEQRAQVTAHGEVVFEESEHDSNDH